MVPSYKGSEDPGLDEKKYNAMRMP